VSVLQPGEPFRVKRDLRVMVDFGGRFLAPQLVCGFPPRGNVHGRVRNAKCLFEGQWRWFAIGAVALCWLVIGAATWLAAKDIEKAEEL